MPIAPLLALALAVSASPKVAVLGLSGVGLEKAKADFFTEHFAGKLRDAGLSVVTQSEVGALLGFERQRQLLGCSDESSTCMTELAAALGTDVVSLGAIAKLDGEVYQVTLKLLASRDGKVLAQQSGRVTGAQNLTDALTRAAHELGRQVLAALRPEQAVEPLPDFRLTPLRSVSWLPAGLGVASLGAGVVFAVLANASFQRLVDPMGLRFTDSQATTLASEGKTQQLLGGLLLGLGAAALGVGAAFFFVTTEGAKLEASLSVTPWGVALAGVWR